MKKVYNSNSNVVHLCRYHVIFCPKYRRKVLVGAIEKRLKELILQKAKQINVKVLALEIMPDHVHVILECDPQLGIAKAGRSIKGFRSYKLQRAFYFLNSLPSRWTPSYFVETLDSVSLDGGKVRRKLEKILTNNF